MGLMSFGKRGRFWAQRGDSRKAAKPKNRNFRGAGKVEHDSFGCTLEPRKLSTLSRNNILSDIFHDPWVRVSTLRAKKQNLRNAAHVRTDEIAYDWIHDGDYDANKDQTPRDADFRVVFTRTAKGRVSRRVFAKSPLSALQFVFSRTHWTSSRLLDIMGCGGSKPKTGKGPFFLSVGSGKRTQIPDQSLKNKLRRSCAAQLLDPNSCH